MSINSSVDGRVLTLRLDRPAKRNALTAQMISELDDAIRDADLAGQIRCIVITGSGGTFSAGADIDSYLDAPADALAQFTSRASDLCRRVVFARVPVIAAVQGVALGGGFELALACDMIIASESATFGLPEVALGLIPGWGGTQRLTRHVGPMVARELIWLGTRLSAAEAQNAGIVNRIVPPDSLDATAASMAATIAALPTGAVQAVKLAISSASTEPNPYGAGFEVEREQLLSLFVSADGREGVRAFAEKRAPRFTE